MSEDSHEETQEEKGAPETPILEEGLSGLGITPAGGPERYSLVEMLKEVHDERQESAMGRELVDANEIEKMFSKRIGAIKKR